MTTHSIKKPLSLLKLPAASMITLLIIILMARLLVGFINQQWALPLLQNNLENLPYIHIPLKNIGMQFSVLVILLNHFKIYRFTRRNIFHVILFFLLFNLIFDLTIGIYYTDIIDKTIAHSIQSPLLGYIENSLFPFVELGIFTGGFYLYLQKYAPYFSPLASPLQGSTRYWRNINLLLLFFMLFSFEDMLWSLFIFLPQPQMIIPFSFDLENSISYQLYTHTESLFPLINALCYIATLILLSGQKKIAPTRIFLKKIIIITLVWTGNICVISYILSFTPYLSFPFVALFFPLLASVQGTVIGFILTRHLFASKEAPQCCL